MRSAVVLVAGLLVLLGGVALAGLGAGGVVRADQRTPVLQAGGGEHVRGGRYVVYAADGAGAPTLTAGGRPVALEIGELTRTTSRGGVAYVEVADVDLPAGPVAVVDADGPVVVAPSPGSTTARAALHAVPGVVVALLGLLVTAVGGLLLVRRRGEPEVDDDGWPFAEPSVSGR